MGLILDTSIFVYAERRGESTEQVLERFSPLEKLSVSAVTRMELAHGVARAKTERISVQRGRWIRALQAEFSISPLDADIAVRVGILDGERRGNGFSIGLADAIVAATALHLGYGVAALNVRHFKLVPALDVVEL